MGLLASKALTLLASPVGITLSLGIIALFVSYLGRHTLARIFMLLAIVWLWLSSTQFVANIFYASLENTYSPASLTNLPSADAIVLLGGGIEPAVRPRTYPGLNQAGDRILHATRLYKAGKANKIVVSGGQVFPDEKSETEADYSKILLLDWDIPPENIVLEKESRTTHENALETKKIFKQNAWQRALLVTSAAHMPRSVCSFEKMGITVIPAPTDYELDEIKRPLILQLLPSSHAQNIIARGMKEYLGRWIYQWRGWC